MPVSILDTPVPSRSSCSRIWVSFVLRSTRACRGNRSVAMGAVLLRPIDRRVACADFGGAAVPGEALHLGERPQMRQRRLQAGRRVLDHARAGDEVLGAERGG